MQAVFFVDVTYPAGLVALANTEPLPLTTARGGGLQKQWHAPTPVMSPYLLAICIGRLVSKHTHTGELTLLKRKHTLDGEWSQRSLPYGIERESLFFAAFTDRFAYRYWCASCCVVYPFLARSA